MELDELVHREAKPSGPASPQTCFQGASSSPSIGAKLRGQKPEQPDQPLLPSKAVDSTVVCGKPSCSKACPHQDQPPASTS